MYHFDSSSISSSEGGEEKNNSSSSYILSLILLVLNIIIIKSASLEQFELIGLGDRWKFHNYIMWSAAAALIALLVLLWLGYVTVVSDNDCMANLVKGMVGLCTVGLIVISILQYVFMGQIWDSDPEHTIFFYNAYWTEGVTNMNIPTIPTSNTTFTSLTPTNVTRNLLEMSLPLLAGTTKLAGTTTISNITTKLAGTTTISNITTKLTLNLRGSVKKLYGSLIASHFNQTAIKVYRRLQENTLASEWVYVMSDVVIRIYGFCLLILPVILAVAGCCGGTGWACGKCLS